MRNYVKEIEFIERRKTSSENFLLPLLAGLFFIGYSGLIFIYSQEYYKMSRISNITLKIFLIPLATGASVFREGNLKESLPWQ